MVEPDVHDNGSFRRCNHICGIEPAAQARLQNDDVAAFGTEPEEGGGGHQFKGRRRLRKVFRSALNNGKRPEKSVVGDLLSVDLHALLKTAEIRRGEEACTVSCRAEDRRRHGGAAPLAVRPRYMDELQIILRIPEKSHQFRNAGQAGFRAEPGGAVQTGYGRIDRVGSSGLLRQSLTKQGTVSHRILGTADPVYRSGSDAARIARSFPAWIQTYDRRAADCIPENADRRGRAGLRCGQDGIRIGKPRQLPVKGGDGGRKHRTDFFGEHTAEISPFHLRQISRLHAARSRAGAGCEKITDQLRRSGIVAGRFCVFKRSAFKFTLPLHSGKHPFSGEILRTEGNKESRVGILPRPAGIAHAVGTDAVFFACRRKHVSPRTHAEGIGAAAVRQADIERIIRRRQHSSISAVLRRADIFLQVFNPHAHREGFLLHGNALGKQVFKRVPRGMADGENCRCAGYEFRPGRSSHLSPAEHIPAEAEAVQTGFKAYFPTERKDLLPDPADDGKENIRPDMRLRIIEYAFRSAVLIKCTQNERNTGIVRTGIQLSV